MSDQWRIWDVAVKTIVAVRLPAALSPDDAKFFDAVKEQLEEAAEEGSFDITEVVDMTDE